MKEIFGSQEYQVDNNIILEFMNVTKRFPGVIALN